MSILASEKEKLFVNICKDGAISINTVNRWWLDSFYMLKQSCQNSDIIKGDEYHKYSLIKSDRNKIYLVYEQRDQIMAWTQVSDNDFKSYGHLKI